MSELIKWKVKGLYKADPQAVYNELQTLDEITPDAVVELARNENSVLHNEIDWDDEVAAEKWRKQQARLIICNLVIEVQEREDEEPTTLRLFHKPDENKTYQELQVFVKDEDEYQKLLNQAKRDLESFKTKYHILKELHSIFVLIDAL